MSKKHTEVLLKNGTDYWHIDTHGEKGKVLSTLCHGTGSGDGFWSYNMFGGGFRTLIKGRFPRVTEKIVAEQHREAIRIGTELFQKITSITPKIEEAERPDRPCDEGCSRRIHSYNPCDCSRTEGGDA